MSASALSTFGIQVQRGDGASPEVFTAIAELLDVTGPGLDSLMLDATSHDSTNNARDKIAAKIVDAGQVVMNLHFLPGSAGHKALITDMYAFTRKNWKLSFPDSPATVWPFVAMVQHIEMSAPFEDKLTFDVTLEISGKPTFPA